MRDAAEQHWAHAQDVRRQLYSMDDDRTFFDWIQKELRAVERRLEDGRAVLAHLEGALINVSCNDPGAVVGQQLALPILQERLDAQARDYAAQRAAAAEEAIIKEEVQTRPWPRSQHAMPQLQDACCVPTSSARLRHTFVRHADEFRIHVAWCASQHDDGLSSCAGGEGRARGGGARTAQAGQAEVEGPPALREGKGGRGARGQAEGRSGGSSEGCHSLQGARRAGKVLTLPMFMESVL